MPQVSPALRAKVCEHLRGQLSAGQLDDLDKGTAPHFHRGRRGDPVVTQAYAAFMNSMHGELSPERFTKEQFVEIGKRWIVRYSRFGPDGCENVRKPRTLLSEGEWAEAADIIATPIESNEGMTYWRSAQQCLDIEHSKQQRFEYVSCGTSQSQV